MSDVESSGPRRSCGAAPGNLGTAGRSSGWAPGSLIPGGLENRGAPLACCCGEGVAAVGSRCRLCPGVAAAAGRGPPPGMDPLGSRVRASASSGWRLLAMVQGACGRQREGRLPYSGASSMLTWARDLQRGFCTLCGEDSLNTDAKQCNPEKATCRLLRGSGQLVSPASVADAWRTRVNSRRLFGSHHRSVLPGRPRSPDGWQSITTREHAPHPTAACLREAVWFGQCMAFRKLAGLGQVTG